MASSVVSVDSLVEVAKRAHERPVVTNITDLDARILEQKHGIEIVESYREFCLLFESSEYQFSGDVVIRGGSAELNLNRSMTTYSPPPVDQVRYSGSIYTDQLNSEIRGGSISWKDVGETTLRQSQIADRIVNESEASDVVALVIVDGLSYGDWVSRGYSAEPVYVDCPTITACGYPNTVYGGVNGDHIASRLFEVGFSARLGFSYWEKDNNELTKNLHKQFSDNDVIGDIQDFGDIISYLNSNHWYKGPTYLQITLTGPERVAHKHKEDPSISSEVEQVHDKLQQLRELLSDSVPSFKMFATADHGILWRMGIQDELSVIDGDWKHYDRRCIEAPSENTSLSEEYGRREEWDGSEYLRLDYPYLFGSLRSNEPGTHGGYSFQESIVPLIEMG